jgi:hypothetical protein
MVQNQTRDSCAPFLSPREACPWQGTGREQGAGPSAARGVVSVALGARFRGYGGEVLGYTQLEQYH